MRLLFLILSVQILLAQTWPLPSGYETFTSAYGPRVSSSGYDFHLGVDLQASIGTEVFAATEGVAVYVDDENTTGAGNTIKIYDNNWEDGTGYYHLNDIIINQYDYVEEGELIGHSGNTMIRQYI